MKDHSDFIVGRKYQRVTATPDHCIYTCTGHAFGVPVLAIERQDKVDIVTVNNPWLWQELPKTRVFKRWVNIYSGHNTAYFHRSKEAADKKAGPDRVACILIEREYEEGEGL